MEDREAVTNTIKEDAGTLLKVVIVADLGVEIIPVAQVAETKIELIVGLEVVNHSNTNFN